MKCWLCEYNRLEAGVPHICGKGHRASYLVFNGDEFVEFAYDDTVPNFLSNAKKPVVECEDMKEALKK